MMKVLRIILLCGVCFALLMGVLSYFWMRHYIYSPFFKEDIEQLASKKLEGEFKVSNLNPENWGFKAGEVSLKNSGKIANLKIKGFKTHFQKWALFKKTWYMRDLGSDEVEIYVTRGEKEVTQQIDKQKITANVKECGKRKVKRKPIFHKFLPTNFEFKTITVDKCSGSIQRDKKDIEWEGVVLNGRIKNDALDMNLSKGQITLPLKILPVWNVDQVNVSFTEESFTIHNAKFNHPKGGIGSLHGNGDYMGDLLELNMDFQSVPVSSLIKEDKHTGILTGMVNGELKAYNQHDDTAVKGRLFLSDGELAFSKTLKPILRLLGHNSNNEILINQCVGDIQHIGDNTVIDNLYIEAKEMFSITGRIELLNDKYRGMFRFGLPEKIYKKLPKNSVINFSKYEGNYWALHQVMWKGVQMTIFI